MPGDFLPPRAPAQNVTPRAGTGRGAAGLLDQRDPNDCPVVLGLVDKRVVKDDGPVVVVRIAQQVEHPLARGAVGIVAQLEAVGFSGPGAVQLCDDLDVEEVSSGPYPEPTLCTRRKVSFPWAANGPAASRLGEAASGWLRVAASGWLIGTAWGLLLCTVAEVTVSVSNSAIRRGNRRIDGSPLSMIGFSRRGLYRKTLT